MDSKTIAIIAAGAIAVMMFKPDLLSNLFKGGQPSVGSGGASGGGVVVVSPVVTQPYTYYDINVGAPTFPDAPMYPMGMGIMDGQGSGGASGGGAHHISGYTASRSELEQMAAQPIQTATSRMVGQFLGGLESCEG